MSSKIQALPLPQRQARLRLAGPLAVLATLAVAAGVVGLLALRQGEPAAGPTAAYENSGVITGTGPALAELAGMNAAYENSGVITGTGPALQDLAGRYSAYRNSAISGTGPALAEIRGVDVIGIRPSSVWPSEAALERAFDGAAIASANFPSVAALERQFGSSIASVHFPSVAALERQFASIASANFPSVAAMERALGLAANSPGFPSVAAMERWINGSSVPEGCRLVRHGPC